MSEISNLNTSNPNQGVIDARETEAPESAPVSETSHLESEVRGTTDLNNSSNPPIRKSQIAKKSGILPKHNFKEFKTVEYLKEYKLYTEGKSKVLNIAAVRVIHTNIKPTVDNIRQSRILLSTRFLTNVMDRATLSVLLLAERILPSMKTSGTNEITHAIVKPVTVPIRLAVEVGNAAIEAGTYFIYRPYHNELIRFRHFYNRKLIDTEQTFDQR
ncbi:hypothetical protein C6P45_002298 [Maudiozyma exigua]|uniref:Uncharacterized protein n=1 Tax=Maudiozyma exigua TaxID=34358 RepID=A0A9P7B4F6_MAUEX|nr:hypothetical protein C6P45_002298 [Kazachstania exigua]